MRYENSAAGSLLGMHSTCDVIELQLKHAGYWVGNYFNYFITLAHRSDDWRAFLDTWDGLPPDEFMADGGKYRRRRFTELRYNVQSDEIGILPHKPFFQDTYNNALNGGVDRHFEPITPYIATHPFIKRMIRDYVAIFTRYRDVAVWQVYVHQVRITSSRGIAGFPTPEGIHKDGVTFSSLFCINRTENCVGAENFIYDNDKNVLERFTLTGYGDLVIFDDSKVYHSVSQMNASDDCTASRDMLFLEFTAQGGEHVAS
ncbi:2OG-Fe dioxygenase family protein [Pseudomonas sp. E2-15]|uniref:2OG-Fe dioxygenase family protein n=1 Tax=Pseudomonas sp. D47 TaxID=3159447 RepID=UPI00387ADDFD